MADAPVSPLKPHDTTETTPEHIQETGRVSPLGTETPAPPKSSTPKPRVSFQEQDQHLDAPPPKPPRPASPMDQSEHTLIEAFPTIDAKVVRAVLHASGGRLEPAFEALLGMSDPNFVPEESAPPPPQPPRPQTQTQRQPKNQLEADEMYARQLAEQYNTHSDPYQQQRGQTRYNQREPGQRRPNQQKPVYNEDDREHSFFDDDLPEIGRNIQQGFFETQKKVNSWISNFRKRLDGDDADEEDEDLYSASQPSSRQNTNRWAQGGGGVEGRQNFGPSQSEQLRGIQRAAEQRQQQQQRSARQSTEAARYDADPHQIGDDEFERLELRDNDDDEVEELPPAQPPRRTSSRLPAKADLFKPQPKPPQSGPVDEVDAGERGGKGKKWQSLTSIQPQVVEDDADPFALGDDEEDVATTTAEGKGKGVEVGKEEVRQEDTERLKKSASTSVSEGKSGGGAAEGEGDRKGKGKALEESGRSGSVDLEAKELLAGKGPEKE
ncbi:hypothetical protein BAUCODRAFT_61481 [Baudoinia panamericana UAMH 10762]|uniref:CUE domain-containing protein n=1 Tax=Baudoinia panamericana (strain UAMH 10762) TaxID=717646 RepID=M2NQF4_BAUPA|nr:uncharacterized protein BAUCODRAFT_61481 [Baudoinia panamericana UAMH 10762]EMD01281.1 hypothetical protein BAUCODRAFT_61481 [Baudoinia panamericana UAMH 10762]